VSDCRPEQVTGFVDGALDESAGREMEAHLATCEGCRQQADSERLLRSRLLGLLHPPLPAGLDARVRERLVAPRRPSWGRRLVPLAAMAAVLLLTLRSTARFVAWELARDHDHCFGRDSLPSEVASDDAETVMRWFEARGTRVPVLPGDVQGLELVGARYCWMPDLSRAVHVYYRRAKKGPLSVFVLSRGIGKATPVRLSVNGHFVQMVRQGDRTVGLVADREEDLDAFAHALTTTRASIRPEDGGGELRRLAAN
jgi:anti-sigma factor RsiW